MCGVGCGVGFHQYAFEAAALYAAIYIYFAAAGGGKYSVDAAISKDE